MSTFDCHPRIPALARLVAVAAIVLSPGALVHADSGGGLEKGSGDSFWQLLVGDRAGMPAGFDQDSWAVTAMQEWGGALYLGASTDPSSSYGCQVWRTTDGLTFTQVVKDGFGDSDNTELPAMAVFQEHLYAGTSNYDYGGDDSGARLWRTADGVTWELVSSPGFGDPHTGHLRSLAVFDGALYVGLGKRYAVPPRYESSVQIWRSNSGQPGSWALVFEEETSPSELYVADALVVFGNQLYCVLADPETWLYPKLRRTTDGTHWEEVPDFDLQCWFDRGESASATVLGDHLYVAIISNLDGGLLCRSRDGVTWEPVPDVLVTKLATFAGALYAGRPYGGVLRSANGLVWEGLGPGEINGAVHAFGSLRGRLYVSSMNPHQGCEVWRLFEPFPPWYHFQSVATQ